MMKRDSLFGCLVASAVMCSLASCSDDEKVVFSAPKDTKTQIQLDCRNSFVDLPIVASGKWTVTATAPDGTEAPWVFLLDGEGKGNATVCAAIDFNETEVAREAVVRFTNGSQTLDYRLTQGTYDNTDEGANSERDVKYHNSGIGKTLQIKAGGTGTGGFKSLMKQQVFNYAQMGDQAVADVPDLVTETHITEAQVNFSDFSTLQNQATSIAANLSVDVNYGLFKLGLTGNFKLYGASQDTLRTYAASATIPKMTLDMDYMDLAFTYLPWQQNMDGDYKLKRSKLFSAAFLNYHDKIEQTVAELYGNPSADKAALQRQLDSHLGKLNTMFGPVFTTSVKKGGSVGIDFMLRNSEASDTLAIGGKLTAAFGSLFSLSAEAAAEYLNTTNSFTQGSTLNVSIQGGQPGAISVLASSLKSIVTANPNGTEHMLNAIMQWSEGVTVENSTVTEVSADGIWELFSDEAPDYEDEHSPRSVVKRFMQQAYPNDDKGNCPYLFNIAAM